MRIITNHGMNHGLTADGLRANHTNDNHIQISHGWTLNNMVEELTHHGLQVVILAPIYHPTCYNVFWSPFEKYDML